MVGGDRCASLWAQASLQVQKNACGDALQVLTQALNRPILATRFGATALYLIPVPTGKKSNA